MLRGEETSVPKNLKGLAPCFSTSHVTFGTNLSKLALSDPCLYLIV
jgi:hypothetical protein